MIGRQVACSLAVMLVACTTPEAAVPLGPSEDAAVGLPDTIQLQGAESLALPGLAMRGDRSCAYGRPSVATSA